MAKGERRRARPLRRALRVAQTGTQNVLEAVRLARVERGTTSPFEIVDRDAMHRLRRYAHADVKGAPVAPIILVPPLMLTAEIYDISPDLSAIAPLAAAGVDAWVVDFGSPTEEEGGMQRTLDDHVRTVVKAVRTAKRVTGHDVHLAGYSQGGMFAYQAAAALRSEALASLITFGSPVDVHRNVPFVSDDGVASAVLHGLRKAIDFPLRQIEGLPGILTSTAFKMLTPRKEVEQLVDLVLRLHDRQDLEKRAARRRFLGGEGFVAWPGPALRAFVDELIVQNRMMHGGIVIDGRTVTLADITVPILACIGLRDEIARPEAVRGIRRAAPHAEVHEIGIEAGHFGIVVGSRALRETWPAVIEWIRWREQKGGMPRMLAAPAPTESDDWEGGEESWDFSVPLDHELVRDTITSTVTSAASRLIGLFSGASESAAALRWQVPRLRRLERIEPTTRISFSAELAKRANETPDATFFLASGRAFPYGQADARVTHVVKGLFASGVEQGARVGVLMHGRPSLLSVVCALNRMRAVAIVAPPDASDGALRTAFASQGVTAIISDPEHAGRSPHARTLVLGGVSNPTRSLPSNAVDMEGIETSRMSLPSGFMPDAGTARELAMVLLTQSSSGELRASPVTNHRWAFSALGAAAACTLSPQDTVFACLPLHHPAGLLVAVSSALAAGARLALGSPFAPETFFTEVRRAGATVVFYAGEMLRGLVALPPSSADRSHPVRLFAGSGMRRDLARDVEERFGAGVLEIYASTSHHVVMVNASGKKPGAVGRPLPGTAEVVLARPDVARREIARDSRGRVVLAGARSPGIALVRLDARHGDDALLDAARIVTGVLDPGDRFYVLRDVLSRDEDGDHTYVGTIGEAMFRPDGVVFPRAIEDALYRVPGVTRAVVQEVAGKIVGSVAATTPLDAETVAATLRELPPHARPDVVRHVATLPMSAGFRVLAPKLSAADLAPHDGLVVFVREGEAAYRTVSASP